MEPSSLDYARNIATNGRLFSALMVAINLAAYLKTGSGWFVFLAVFAAAPVGLACIADQLPACRLRSLLSLTSYSVSAAVAFLLIVTIG